MKKTYCFVFIIIFCLFKLNAQSRGHVCYATVVDGDTIPLIYLKELHVVSYYRLLTEEEIRKNAKLIRNVKKTYPYAKLAKQKLLLYNDTLSKISNEKKRKEIMKRAEKEIEDEFGGELKKLTISQGKVLIKLIDRETGNSSFLLVRELRGKFRAFFYQTFAKIFGLNLKTRYNPMGNKEDELIERIIRSIELKQI